MSPSKAWILNILSTFLDDLTVALKYRVPMLRRIRRAHQSENWKTLKLDKREKKSDATSNDFKSASKTKTG